jgi:hypothetical protein
LEVQSIFGIHLDLLKAVKGGFFLMKKSLECMLSVYINPENAIRVFHNYNKPGAGSASKRFKIRPFIIMRLAGKVPN